MLLRKTILAAALSSAVALGGCADSSIFTGGPVTSTQITTVIAQAQKIAQTTCSFLPTASTIANIFASGNPALQTATEIANAICGALVAKSARRSASPPSVAGVEIHGRFVR